MNVLKMLAALLIAGLALGVGFLYSGVYDVGADQPHWPLTFSLMQTLRDRSVEERIGTVQVPKLDDPQRIAEGAEHYSAMCTGCHLAPGLEDTALRQGLYPQPPKLFEQSGEDPAEQFWVIKHGLKMTAMPAWGATHDDDAIWNLVAFLQALPRLSAGEYERMTAAAMGPMQDEDPRAGHRHDGH